MKKILKVALAAMMTVGLAACSGNSGEGSDTEQISVGFVTEWLQEFPRFVSLHERLELYH